MRSFPFSFTWLAMPATLSVLTFSSAAEEGKRQLTARELRSLYSDLTHCIFTEWASVGADHQTWESFTKAGYVPVLSEAKLEDGKLFARKGFKHVEDFHPDAARPKCCCYTCVTQAFFVNKNRELLKDNYTLMQMQRFTDDEGEFRFCGIWVKFVPPLPKK